MQCNRDFLNKIEVNINVVYCQRQFQSGTRPMKRKIC